MTKYTWRTDERGIVYVTAPGAQERAPTLGSKDAAVMDSVIARWEVLVDKHAKRLSIPRAWILAMIWRESGGNPSARNPENRADPTDDGCGLMQLTLKYFAGGRTAAQLMDPDTNIGIGANYIVALVHKYGLDFPKISAAYNAGSVRPSDKNPFGMVSTGNHIEAEVAASNYYIMRSLPPEVTGPTIPLTDDEVLRQSAAILAEVERSLDVHDTDPMPEPPTDEPTLPDSPAAKSNPPNA